MSSADENAETLKTSQNGNVTVAKTSIFGSQIPMNS